MQRSSWKKTGFQFKAWRAGHRTAVVAMSETNELTSRLVAAYDANVP